MDIKAIAVFCGSKPGTNTIFEQHAIELGKLLADHNIKVIYGGGNKGLMGAIANATLANRGQVVGIIPKMLCDLEHKHES